jgi:hypothetical protein
MTKDSGKSNEEAKTDKPLSLSRSQDAQNGKISGAQEPHDPSGVKGSPKKAKAPGSPTVVKTPRTEKPSCPRGAKGSPSPAESTKKKSAPPSSQPHGLGATGGAPDKGESTQHNTEPPLQASS